MLAASLLVQFEISQLLLLLSVFPVQTQKMCVRVNDRHNECLMMSMHVLDTFLVSSEHVYCKRGGKTKILLYDLREAAHIQTGHKGSVSHLQVVFYRPPLKLDLKKYCTGEVAVRVMLLHIFQPDFPQDCLYCGCTLGVIYTCARVLFGVCRSPSSDMKM